MALLLSTGERRWYVFSSPAALYRSGDTLPGGDTRIHYGTHRIFLTILTRETIRQAIDELLVHGELVAHTLPLAPAEASSGQQHQQHCRQDLQPARVRVTGPAEPRRWAMQLEWAQGGRSNSN